jgi:hypothetical protein
MIPPKTRKKLLLVAIALMSGLSFAGTHTADFSPMLKGYGYLLTCQFGFLLFFLQQIYGKHRA